MFANGQLVNAYNMIIVNVLSVNKTKDNNSKQDKYDNLVTGRRKNGKTTLCY